MLTTYDQTHLTNKLKSDVMDKWQKSKTFDWQKSISELDEYVELKIKRVCCYR